MQYILYNIRFGYSISVYIVTMEFTDMYNFDSANIKRECNFMIEPGRVIPFSTYNMGLSQSSKHSDFTEKIKIWKESKNTI